MHELEGTGHLHDPPPQRRQLLYMHACCKIVPFLLAVVKDARAAHDGGGGADLICVPKCRLPDRPSFPWRMDGRARARLSVHGRFLSPLSSCSRTGCSIQVKRLSRQLSVALVPSIIALKSFLALTRGRGDDAPPRPYLLITPPPPPPTKLFIPAS